MQFTTSLISAIVAFSAVSLAAPVPELQVRDNSKLNQYSNPNWYTPPLLVPHQFPRTNPPPSLDNTGGNVPTYHAAPVLNRCYNIDSTTVSFFWALGPLTNMHVYAGSDCSGLSVDIGKDGKCQSVNVNYSNDFQKILSIKMT
ncbi:hypothetical protein L207DRAFT_515454 [Hyaloscypha variabilis F]|uniref:Uncharacterized protein n=1 Tax=Hyaloscypha variabilis (strain UAMH 11265 / GT02V1 / F) TaxID=1149755 RepID=A0A2J6RER8_HYAVF|nr:hypothetical protein L207DRAFT_515454 [Hyaloscypha variabilis F]